MSSLLRRLELRALKMSGERKRRIAKHQTNGRLLKVDADFFWIPDGRAIELHATKGYRVRRA